MDTAVIVLTAVVMAAGLLGTIVPILPGLLLIWLAAITYGLVEGFGTTGAVAVALITVLMVVGTVAKYVLPKRHGAQAGAGASTLAAACLFGLIGFFVIPIIGLPLGAVAGVYLAERRRLRTHQLAWRSTVTVVKAFGVGVLIEMGAGVAMIAAWVVWVVLGP